MRIGGVDFPEPLLNALRDGRLVVFAGAGVSMGPPAMLPSFRKLAEKVAEGTGQSIAASETDDQFLGRLKEDGVRVHQRAAEILQPDKLKPNALHRNLLRLFQEKDDPVRIVTTNFDCLFEQAAEKENMFKTQPKVFEAPALPLGSDFQGIIHLHGSVNEPEKMVLTHRDFGRAYLTEGNGWACRFLLDLFAKHIILFIGYSHSDTIMNYLTPSLPSDAKERLFALVGSKSKDLDRWHTTGIEPIAFPQAEKSDFTYLDIAVKEFADFGHLDLWGWQQKIAEIVKRKPPTVDNEDSHTINHALTSVELTQFFVRAAKFPEWIDWLYGRGYLKRLFTEGELEERDKILSQWLAYQFIGSYSDQLLSVILPHYGRLNGYFWNQLLRELGRSEGKPLDPQILSRWIHILMNRVPIDVDEYFLLNLMKHCAEAREFQSLLQVYDVITVRLIRFLPDFEHSRNDSWDNTMKELWEQCLRSNFQHIAHALLERTTMRLEQRHSARVAWSSQDNNMMSGDNCSRPAIEFHEQNEYPYGSAIDPLIDVARDCLECLVVDDPMTVKNWCNRFVKSDSPPLLRRLAIHATNARQDLSIDDKMAWLLEHYDVNEYEAKHEIFRMAADVYPEASSQQRKALIQAISQYQLPAEALDDSAAQLAYYQFNWFQWLHNADQNCSLLEAELDKIRSQYPEFQPREHPDLNYWRGEASRCMGPWTVEDLLARPASECLSNLLDYHPNTPELAEKDRMSMLITVCNAAERDPSWGLDLADAMAEKSEWKSDLWTWVISVWESERTDLDQDRTRRVLSHLSTSELHQPRHARAIAGVLNRLIWNPDATDLTKWLDTLHKIAIVIHPHAIASEDRFTKNSQDRNWYQEATNHASGKLAEFWLHSICHWYNQQTKGNTGKPQSGSAQDSDSPITARLFKRPELGQRGFPAFPKPPQALSPEYRQALNTIIEDHGIPGKLGRTILASRFHLLHDVDSGWTEQHLLPLFDAKHEDFPCAWDGYLACGRLFPPIAELLKDKFIGGLQRAIQDFSEKRLEHFIHFYVLVMSRLMDNAQGEWICEFFKHEQKKPELKNMFTTQVGRFLCKLDESSQNEWWRAWLKNYWSNRLQGVPCPLDDAEIARMFEWAIHLQGVFPEAVDMALQMGPVPLELPLYLQLSHNIGKINLINRYPVELAQLLIHLGKCQTSPWFWYQDSQILHQLLEKDLPEDLKQELQETIRRIDISSSSRH